MMSKPLIVTARRLADLLDRENTALRSMNLRGATTLLAEKSAVVAELSAFVAPTGDSFDPDLRAMARRLDALAQENRRLLQRAIVAQKRVISIIVRAAIAASAGTSYGIPGRPPRPTGPMTLSTRA